MKGHGLEYDNKKPCRRRDCVFQSLRGSMLTIESSSKKYHRLQIGRSPFVNIKNHCGLVMQELLVIDLTKMVMKISGSLLKKITNMWKLIDIQGTKQSDWTH